MRRQNSIYIYIYIKYVLDEIDEEVPHSEKEGGAA